MDTINKTDITHFSQELVNCIFSQLTMKNLINLRMVSHSWSSVIFNLLFSRRDSGFEHYQLQYLIKLLGESDAIFQDRIQHGKIYLPATANPELLFYNTLVNLRATQKTLFISDRFFDRLLHHVEQAKEPMALTLLNGVGWALSPGQKKKSDLKIDGLLVHLYMQLLGYPKKLDIGSLNSLVFFKGRLKVEQIYEIISALINPVLAQQFPYGESKLSLLLNELPSQYVEGLVDKIFLYLDKAETNENGRINLLTMLRLLADRFANPKKLTGYLKTMRLLSENHSVDIRRNVLMTLRVLVSTQKEQPKEILQDVKLFWEDCDSKIRNMATEIYMQYVPAYKHDEIMHAWYASFLKEKGDPEAFYQKLDGTEQQRFLNHLIEQLLIGNKSAIFCPLKMDMLEKLLYKLHPEQIQPLVFAIQEGLEHQEPEQNIAAFYLLNVMAPILQETCLLEFSSKIKRLIQANNPHFLHHLLNLMEKILPYLVKIEPVSEYLDFLLSGIMHNNPYTINQALLSLSTIASSLKPQQQKQVMDSLKKYFVSDFEQALPIFACYIPQMEPDLAIKSLSEILMLNLELEDRLQVYSTLYPFMDIDQKKGAWDLIAKQLEKGDMTCKMSVLKVFFSLAAMVSEDEWPKVLDAKTVCYNLELLLKNPNENHRKYRRFAGEKVLQILNANVFPEALKLCAAKQFCNGKPNIESIYASFVSQCWLEFTYPKDALICLSSLNDKYVLLARKFPSYRKHETLQPLMVLREEGCDFLSQVLGSMVSGNERYQLVENAMRLELFSTLKPMLSELKASIKLERKTAILDIEDFVIIEQEASEDMGFTLI